MSNLKRRKQAVNRRRWAAEALGVDVVEPALVERRDGARLVLIPGTRKVASSPWRQRLWDSRHPKPAPETEVSA